MLFSGGDNAQYCGEKLNYLPQNCDKPKFATKTAVS